jgi:hypothetical protein
MVGPILPASPGNYSLTKANTLVTTPVPPVSTALPFITSIIAKEGDVKLNNFTLGQNRIDITSMVNLAKGADGNIGLFIKGVQIATFIGGNVTLTTPLSEILV